MSTRWWYAHDLPTGSAIVRELRLIESLPDDMLLTVVDAHI